MKHQLAVIADADAAAGRLRVTFDAAVSQRRRQTRFRQGRQWRRQLYIRSQQAGADIFAKTTESDGDFVVKLIDVYPDEVAGNPKMGGYQLPISLDIFRGRYRDSFEKPSAIPAGKTQRYRFRLPTVNHVFQPGHRIMVQIQSSLFPLYDCNPQTFVPNIFLAKSADYQKATVTLERGGAAASAVWLPLVPSAK